MDKQITLGEQFIKSGLDIEESEGKNETGLVKARKYYAQALAESEKAGDIKGHAKAALALANASAALADLRKTMDKSTENIQWIKENTSLALQHFKIASDKSQPMDAKWKENLEMATEKCIKGALLWTLSHQFKFRKAVNVEFINLLPDGGAKAVAIKEHANALLSMAKVQLDTKDYIQCLRFGKDAKTFLEKGNQMNCQAKLAGELQQLSNDVDDVICQAQVMQEYDRANSSTRDIRFEDIDEDIAFHAIDLLDKALDLSAGRKVEAVAVVLCHIARLYDKVPKVKNDRKAMEYYSQAADVGKHLAYSDYSCKEWFKECQAYMSRFQSHSKALDKDTALAKYPEIESKIAQLKSHKDDKVSSFLAYVYQTFPPRQGSSIFDSSLPEKKMLRNARKHYHPDHYRNKEPLMQVLSGEICLIIDVKSRECV